jgi:hypothetical protein
LGTPPAFPGDRGFTGGTTDTITGLTNLGAREYNVTRRQCRSACHRSRTRTTRY